MVLGIGVDLCDITRMKKAAAQKGFKEKVFSAAEIEYAEKFADSASHYAAAFAAKEALAKAGGWGIGNMGLDSCSVVRTERGPKFEFTESFNKRLSEFGASCVHLSISHEAGMAVAMVILEG